MCYWLVQYTSTHCKLWYDGVWIILPHFLPRFKELLLLHYVKLNRLSVESSSLFTMSWSHHLIIRIVPGICSASAQSLYMGQKATFYAMIAFRPLMYSLMWWIPAASIATTTGGYSNSPPLPRVSIVPWSAWPPNDGTTPVPLTFPPSPPRSHCHTNTPTEPLPNTSYHGPTTLLL